MQPNVSSVSLLRMDGSPTWLTPNIKHSPSGLKLGWEEGPWPGGLGPQKSQILPLPTHTSVGQPPACLRGHAHWQQNRFVMKQATCSIARCFQPLPKWWQTHNGLVQLCVPFGEGTSLSPESEQAFLAHSFICIVFLHYPSVFLQLMSLKQFI